MPPSDESLDMSRRAFLASAGGIGLLAAIGGLAACSPSNKPSPKTSSASASPSGTGGTSEPSPTTSSASASPGGTGGTLIVGMTAANIPGLDTALALTAGFEGTRFVGLQMYDALTRWDLLESRRRSAHSSRSGNRMDRDPGSHDGRSPCVKGSRFTTASRGTRMLPFSISGGTWTRLRRSSTRRLTRPRGSFSAASSRFARLTA